jgi:basic amino acid/polyamine antiporter, APA family
MPEPARPTVVRAIGRWSLAALTINCIVGSGVFGLPSVISAQVGNASPFAWIFAALASGLIMACFAEVSSRFEESGGVYLYSRTAFGRTAGIGIAWLGWLGRVTAAAANANLFVIYLAEFWPAAKDPIPKIAVLTVVLGAVTVVNYIGVRRGTLQSNLFTGAKLLTLAVFVAVGIFFLLAHHHAFSVALPSGPASRWLDPVLLLMFAYGGYETALMPGGEVSNPRRDYPFALFAALITCTVVYTLTQWIVISVLPLPLISDRPMAAAAQVMLGTIGASLVSIGVLLSTYGYLSANVLGFPRLLFAMAEQGDMPETMARVHARFRTPHIAILVFAVLLYVFSITGSFRGNLFISAVSRLLYYGSVCAALPLLRRKHSVPAERFHLAFGDVFALLGVGVSLLLFPKLQNEGVLIMAGVAGCIALNTIWASRRTNPRRAEQTPIPVSKS